MKTSGLALTSLFWGLLLPLVLFISADRQYLVSPWENSPKVMWLIFLVPIIAIVCGHLALFNSGESRRQKYLAIGALFLGYAEILTIFSYPILNHQRPHFESTAVGSLRTLNEAAHGFTKLRGSFPRELSELACAKDIQNFDWCIDSALANGTKGAYRFTYAQKQNENSQLGQYEIHADPTKSTPFTRYHFFMDETGTIRYEPDKSATLKSTPLD